MAKEENNPSLISEVLKWVSLSKGGRFVGLGAIMLLASAVLFYYIGLTPVKYRGVELVWLWLIGEILLLPGIIIVIAGVLVIILGLIASLRGYSSQRNSESRK